ncbi:MAG: hypothetical protein HN579_10775 [Gammaproteobacteria bacterium]|nr:hypothetical protein [Gammaproteobacteria bacterium]
MNRKEMQLGREAGKTEARSEKRETRSKKLEAIISKKQETRNKKQEIKNKTTAALRPGLDVQAYQPTDRRAICAQTSNKGRVKVADDLKWRSKNGSDHCTGCQQR